MVLLILFYADNVLLSSIFQLRLHPDIVGLGTCDSSVLK